MQRFILILILLPFISRAQSSQDVIKDKDNYAFGQIYIDFRYSFNDDYRPKTAFEFNQGIIGYYHSFGKISGKIMFDVTRTTNITSITDSTGSPMKVTYFEGSKYTAYLKMAEITWDIDEHFTLRIGQLLNTQYLTFIDPFWGYRFIDVTFQEKYRIGQPADFGMQLDYKLGEKFLNQLSVVNGEGPFRYQDVNSGFIFSNNIQYSPVKHLVLKLYIDYGPTSDTAHNKADKSVISGFAGYKTDKFRVGAEFDQVWNYNWDEGYDLTGYSVFGAYDLNEKINFMARYDHLANSLAGPPQEYVIAGIGYNPITPLTTSLNYRYNVSTVTADVLYVPSVYVSFGLKF